MICSRNHAFFLKKNHCSFSRFILIFSLESPTLQHLVEGLQTLKILLGGRLMVFATLFRLGNIHDKYKNSETVNT